MENRAGCARRFTRCDSVKRRIIDNLQGEFYILARFLGELAECGIGCIRYRLVLNSI
ncbi:hypothetical protein NITLEN_20409 [Nitrospira lenta]|uniref:Uncharacterized protein n=1 Tax=Nitrospira lenta TaxID=1436998 RepID=A0A330LCL0_9BACT|nr:hypothetical protein NITLEN_20409 [Nitrospira lenta]